MNNKIKLCISTLLLSLLITGCGTTSKPTTPTNTSNNEPTSVTTTSNNNGSSNLDTTIPLGYVYKITFKNYDGSILYSEFVAKDVIPTYKGIVPKKPASKTHYYTFKGWDKELTPVKNVKEYVATFEEHVITEEMKNHSPIVSSDNKTVTYGYYPNTYVNDDEINHVLDTLNKDSNGYVTYNNEYYYKVTSSVYNNESYTFNDGETIVDQKDYWFKCEPIVWNILSVKDNVYKLMSSTLLDVTQYHSKYEIRNNNNHENIYSNNYAYSDVSNYLNETFFNRAFINNDIYIKPLSFEELGSYVYLPSKDELLDSSLGFDSENNLSSTRVAKTTDYTRAMGAWYSKDKGYEFNGTYWTRTPSSEYEYTVNTVNSGGYISEYAVDGTSHCIRPCITVVIE